MWLKFGFSRLRHYPILRVGEIEFPVTELFNHRVRSFLLSIEYLKCFPDIATVLDAAGNQPAGDLYSFHFKDGGNLTLHRYYAKLLIWECVLSKTWDLYLPDFSLRGKTVLDVGAGEGETAWFFLKHGAARIICVEPNPFCLAILSKNIRANNWPVDVIPERFSTSLLKLNPDFAKIDCEGGEEELLRLCRIATPMTIETHQEETAVSLVQRFGMKVVLDGGKMKLLRHKGSQVIRNSVAS